MEKYLAIIAVSLFVIQNLFLLMKNQNKKLIHNIERLVHALNINAGSLQANSELLREVIGMQTDLSEIAGLLRTKEQRPKETLERIAPRFQ